MSHLHGPKVNLFLFYLKGSARPNPARRLASRTDLTQAAIQKGDPHDSKLATSSTPPASAPPPRRPPPPPPPPSTPLAQTRLPPSPPPLSPPPPTRPLRTLRPLRALFLPQGWRRLPPLRAVKEFPRDCCRSSAA
ncbi:hypothetical protein DAI22_01g154200 [Oryza sativa Japonica Group]|nr:hypothetical protein DAI22_01g154200 [Oryza sativa Japonica Group]